MIALYVITQAWNAAGRHIADRSQQMNSVQVA